MTEVKTIGRKALTEAEKKNRDDEKYRNYQKNVSERNRVITEPILKIKILTKTEWVKSKPSGESGKVKFTRLANKRLNKALKTLRDIKNLSTSAYESSPAQVEYIINKLNTAIEDVKTSFSSKTVTESEKIELPV